MIRLIYDADILVYEAATSVERTVQWRDGTYTTVANIEEAKTKFRDILSFWRTGALAALQNNGHDVVHTGEVFAFSCPDRSQSYRKQLPVVGYKSERLGMKRPVVCADLEAWAIEEYCGIWEPALEGDDICGLVATDMGLLVPYEVDETRVIVTHDKDLFQIPSHSWYPRRGELYTPESVGGDDFFYFQILTGDSTDGYKGCPGVGDKTAPKILEAAGPHKWPAIVKAYAAVKPDKRWWPESWDPEKAALATAQVARILRGEEYNWERQEVTLWTPSEVS